MTIQESTAATQHHGGLRAEDLLGTGLSRSDVLDFSTSLNPLGPPPAVREALATLDVSSYPDPSCAALRAALADELGVGAECILAGNGSTELIHLIVRLFVHRGQRPVVFAPTFSEFERAVTIAGGKVYPWTAGPERGFRWALRNKPAVLDRVRPPLVWLCNPNNPTGVYLSRGQVEMVSTSLTGGPLLLDEAYAGFVEQRWPSLDLIADRRVLILRSMTKDYAMPGLRLGYVVAHPEAIAALAEIQPEWSVGSAAQAAGLAALATKGYVEQGRHAAAEAKAYLCESLRSLDLPVIEGAANFMLIRVGDGAALRQGLLALGIAVRDCGSFGLPEFVRIGMRQMPDCRRLVKALVSLRPSIVVQMP